MEFIVTHDNSYHNQEAPDPKRSAGCRKHWTVFTVFKRRDSLKKRDKTVGNETIQRDPTNHLATSLWSRGGVWPAKST